MKQVNAKWLRNLPSVILVMASCYSWLILSIFDLHYRPRKKSKCLCCQGSFSHHMMQNYSPCFLIFHQFFLIIVVGGEISNGCLKNSLAFVRCVSYPPWVFIKFFWENTYNLFCSNQTGASQLMIGVRFWWSHLSLKYWK